MNLKKISILLIPFTIIPVAILSVIPYPSPSTNIIGVIDNTIFWWIIESLILLMFWLAGKYFSNETHAQGMQVIQWYLVWNIFSFLRGTFLAENYWDWKGLVGNSLGLLIPVIAYLASNTTVVQSVINCYLKYALPLFFIFILIIHSEAFGFYLVPISFLILFLPVLTIKWKLVILFFTLIVLLADLGARSNVIKFGVSILLCSLYYFRFLLSNKFYEWIRNALFVAPVLFFLLAIYGVFNVFNMDEFVSDQYLEVKVNVNGEMEEEDLLADTRTLLYQEVLQTAQKYNFWVMGRSPARGNESELFGSEYMTGRGERLGNEVAILNIFTWTGVIGVILYFIIFYKSSYLAVNKSNNIFSKMLGLFIAFRWLYAWIEDINNFTLTTFMLWFMVGLCFSKSFRTMNNKEVSFWVQGIIKK